MIEVGEWIRLKDGRIRQLKWTDGINAQWTRPFGEGLLKEIVKHSKNIIDLIGIGDIVEVVTEKNFEGECTEKFEVAAAEITDFLGNKLNEIGICGDDGIEDVLLKDIKTILTKELYEANCYKIPEKNSGND